MPEPDLARLYATLAGLPKLRDLTFTGAGCGMLRGGVGPLAGATQLTRLCVEHHKYVEPNEDVHSDDGYDSDDLYWDDSVPQRVPFDASLVLGAAEALGSVRELVLQPYLGAMYGSGVRRMVDGLAGSVRHFKVLDVLYCPGNDHPQVRSKSYNFSLDVPARALTVNAQEELTVCDEELGGLLERLLGSAKEAEEAPSALQRLARLRLEGPYCPWRDESRHRAPLGVETLRRLRSGVESFEVKHIGSRMFAGGHGRGLVLDLGPLVHAVETVGLPEWLTLSDELDCWKLRLHPPPPPAAATAAAGGAGGDGAVGASLGGGDAEVLGGGGGGGGGGGRAGGGLELSDDACTRLWVGSFRHCARNEPNTRRYGIEWQHGCVMLHGTPVASLLHSPTALKQVLAQLEAAVETEVQKRLPRDSKRPRLKAYAPMPAAGAMLLEFCHNEAAICAMAVAPAVVRAGAGAAGGDGPGRRDDEAKAVLCADCVPGAGSLLRASTPASTRVLQAVWDATDPQLMSFEERLTVVVEARAQLELIKLTVESRSPRL